MSRKKIPPHEVKAKFTHYADPRVTGGSLYEAIRTLRQEKNLSGVDLCRRTQGLDPRTLTAVEKGRIKNPSIKTLEAIASGLGLSVSDLFRRAESRCEKNFYPGTQKGSFELEFHGTGVKMVAFTPFIAELFCGKILIAGKKSLDSGLLNHPFPIFVSVLMGKFEVKIEDRLILLKEGENLFFNGSLSYSIRNPLLRESVMMLVTSPSPAKA